MKIPAIPAIAAALFFLLPCTSAAQESPEAVYGKFHSAMKAANFEEMKKYGSAEKMRELSNLTPDQRNAMLGFASMLLPGEYTVTGKQLNPDGNSYTLRATAKLPTPPGAKPESANGEISLLKQDGAWKVHGEKWKNADPSIDAGRPVQRIGPLPAATAPKSAAPIAPRPLASTVKATPAKAPAPVASVTKAPCVYKSVMTDEDMQRCR